MTSDLMEKAGKALASAQLLLDAEDSDGATNRAYYAMFDAASAALVWAGVAETLGRPKTHGGLIGSFGLHFVQTGRLAAEFGRSFNQVQELRITGDYVAAPVPLEKARWAVQAANSFVSAVQQLLMTGLGAPEAGPPD